MSPEVIYMALLTVAFVTALIALMRERKLRFENEIAANNAYRDRSERWDEIVQLRRELVAVRRRLRKQLEIELGNT